MNVEILRPVLWMDMFCAAQKGDIFVSRGKGWLSKLITWVLHTNISHTFVKINDTHIIEAGDFGVSIKHIKDALADAEYVEWIGFPVKNNSIKYEFLKKLDELLGRPYDYLLLVGGIISRLIHRSRKKPGLFDSKDKYVCSELVARALLECGVKLPFPPSQMTPEDIYYLCKPNKKDSTDATI